jgi:protein-S-isoprenylcysteine O-methyltransferase Ste14
MTTKCRKIFLLVGILTGVLTACLGLETKQTNHLGWVLLFGGAAFSAIGAISLGILAFQEAGDQRTVDRSLWLPLFGVLAISLVTPLEYLFLSPLVSRSDHLEDTGLILCAGGLCFYLLLLHRHDRQMSEEGFTWRTVSRPWTGVMRWICRPIFATLALTALGISIGYASWIGLLIAGLLVIPGLVYRMKMEDRLLEGRS